MTTIDALKKAVQAAQAAQQEIDAILDGAEQPRTIQIRITADTAADAERARQVLEALLASVQCRLRPPRPGHNPTHRPRWMSYGSLVLPGRQRRRNV